jgi:hypothetical protein
MERWPEGPAADPEAARERYDSGMRGTRRALRGAIEADMPAAHLGLGVVAVASVLVGLFMGPAAGALMAGAFVPLFLAALLIMFARGVRGADTGRRAYVLTFGWANWL